MISTLPTARDAAEALSFEGDYLLGRGDIQSAREKFIQAGEALEADRVSIAEEGLHTVKFLAATQFYKAGEYERARRLARDVYEEKLPGEMQHAFKTFLKDLKERTARDYPQKIRQELLNCYRSRNWSEILKLFAEHPYVCEPGGVALLRAEALEHLGSYRVAARNYVLAYRDSPTADFVIGATAILPIELCEQGKVDEAWEYVTYLASILPHPDIYISASVVCSHRLRRQTTDAQAVAEEQLRLIQLAWDGFQKLPSVERNLPDMRDHLAFGLGVAIRTLRWLKRYDEAEELLARARPLDPDNILHFDNPIWTERPLQDAESLREANGLSDPIEAILNQHRDQFAAKQRDRAQDWLFQPAA